MPSCPCRAFFYFGGQTAFRLAAFLANNRHIAAHTLRSNFPIAAPCFVLTAALSLPSSSSPLRRMALPHGSSRGVVLISRNCLFYLAGINFLSSTCKWRMLHRDSNFDLPAHCPYSFPSLRQTSTCAADSTTAAHPVILPRIPRPMAVFPSPKRRTSIPIHLLAAV